MADVPDNVDLNRIARRLMALQDDTRTLRADMDMLIVGSSAWITPSTPCARTFARLCSSQGDLEAAHRNPRRQVIEDRSPGEPGGREYHRLYRC